MGRVVLAIACVLIMAAPARAQKVPPNGSFVYNLNYLSGVVTDEFVATLKQSLASQVSTYPTGSSSGGFTYGFEPSLGIVARTTRSFGPAFAERAITLGRRKLSANVNFQHASFDRFDGASLARLTLYQSNPQVNLEMQLAIDTTTFVVQTGLLSHLDVGVMVPMMKVRMASGVYVTSGDQKVLIGYGGDGSSSGLGDIVVKAKYSIRQVQSRGIAVSADLSLPTGDEFNFRGAGHSRLKLVGVWSTEIGSFAPHVNAGLTLATMGFLTHAAFPLSNGEGPEEFNYSGGVDVIAHSHLTVMTDLIGRTSRHAFRFGYRTDPDGRGSSFVPLNSGDGTLTQLLGSVGFKLNVHGGLLLTTSALVPLTTGGLASRFANVVGFEYAF